MPSTDLASTKNHSSSGGKHEHEREYFMLAWSPNLTRGDYIPYRHPDIQLQAAVSAVDLAPTVLKWLRLNDEDLWQGLDGSGLDIFLDDDIKLIPKI